VVLQETSDQIPTGHIPRVLNVQLRGDITQTCIPGDLVSLSGGFSRLSSHAGCYLPTPFTGIQALRAGLITDTYFYVHNVRHHKTAEAATEGDAEVERTVKKLAKGEVLMVNIGSTSTGGRVMSVKNDTAKIALTKPVGERARREA